MFAKYVNALVLRPVEDMDFGRLYEPLEEFKDYGVTRIW